jgi:hypothetical protein
MVAQEGSRRDDGVLRIRGRGAFQTKSAEYTQPPQSWLLKLTSTKLDLIYRRDG